MLFEHNSFAQLTNGSTLLLFFETEAGSTLLNLCQHRLHVFEEFDQAVTATTSYGVYKWRKASLRGAR
jgi:hypothetical protein